MAALTLLPERTCEEHEDSHNFETTDEHEERAQPLQTVGEVGPRHLRPDVGVESRTDIAHETEGNGEGIGDIDAREHHDGGGDEEHEDIECEERQQGD